MIKIERELLKALTRKMSVLYLSYRKRFVMIMPDGALFMPKRKDGTFTQLTDGMVANHLRQKYAVAVFAGPHASKFICFDVDDGSAETVHAVIDGLTVLGIPKDRIYVSFSGGKGYHVELFFDHLVYTNRLYALYELVIRHRELDPQKVEFRPLPGNAVKLPLSVHGKTGNICWFAKPDT